MVLHRCLSCAARSASTTVNPFASQSFFTESIHLFLGLHFLLHPFTRPCMAMNGMRLWSILAAWSKYLRRLNSTFLTMSLLSFFKLLQMTSFLTRSCLITPAMRLRQLILILSIFCLTPLLVSMFQHCTAVCLERMLRTRVSYTLTLVLELISLDLHILLSRFN